MKTRRLLFRTALVLALACGCVLPFWHAKAAGGSGGGGAPVPVIIQTGFNLWAKNRQASWAFDTWKLGGMMERDAKPTTLSRYFFQNDQAFGNYKSFDVVDSKRISQNSAVLYLAVNFEKAVIFGRFMIYHTDQDWVVQNMDFSPRPEALMPWLAFEGGNYTQ